MNSKNTNKKFSNRSEQQTFKALYDDNFPPLYRIALNYLHDKTEAQEIVATVFAKLWSERHRLKKVKDAKAYLFMMVRNACFDFVKKSSAQPRLISLEDGSNFNSRFLNPEDDLLFHELFDVLDDALSKLPERQLMAFQLIRMEEKSYKEVAKIMGISVSGVEKLVTKAVDRLSQILANYLKGNDRRMDMSGKALKYVHLCLLILSFLSMNSF